MNQFPDEESCELFIISYLEKSGIYCKKCEKVTHHYWFSGAKFYDCRQCRGRSWLKSGTVIENSKLPLQVWMLAFMFISATKKNWFQCLEFKRQLGLSRYEIAFRLMQKINSLCPFFRKVKPGKRIPEKVEIWNASVTRLTIWGIVL